MYSFTLPGHIRGGHGSTSWRPREISALCTYLQPGGWLANHVPRRRQVLCVLIYRQGGGWSIMSPAVDKFGVLIYGCWQPFRGWVAGRVVGDGNPPGDG